MRACAHTQTQTEQKPDAEKLEGSLCNGTDTCKQLRLITVGKCGRTVMEGSGDGGAQCKLGGEPISDSFPQWPRNPAWRRTGQALHSR